MGGVEGKCEEKVLILGTGLWAVATPQGSCLLYPINNIMTFRGLPFVLAQLTL